MKQQLTRWTADLNSKTMLAHDSKEKKLYENAVLAARYYALHPDCKDNLTETLVKFAKTEASREWHEAQKPKGYSLPDIAVKPHINKVGERYFITFHQKKGGGWDQYNIEVSPHLQPVNDAEAFLNWLETEWPDHTKTLKQKYAEFKSNP